MKTRSDTLFTPLLFGGVVVGVGLVARLFVDQGRPVTAGGTPGMLAWILAPAVLALLFKRLDPQIRDDHFFRLSGRSDGHRRICVPRGVRLARLSANRGRRVRVRFRRDRQCDAQPP